MKQIIIASALMIVATLGTALSQSKVSQSNYSVEIREAGAIKANAAAAVEVTLVPMGGYIVNGKYATKLTMTAPAGVTLPKSTMTKTDATTFGDKKVVFKVPFTATAVGKKELKAVLQFSMTLASTVVVQKEQLSLMVDVK